MYLSELTFDPWRRDVPRLLADSHTLHRWLLQAFPDASDGGCGRVLFRAEMEKGEPRLLVQSEREPNWSVLRPMLTADGCRGPKAWQPTFSAGQRLRFRLRANMTVKQGGKRRVLYGASAEETRARQAAWLARKGGQHGFALAPVPEGMDWFDPFGEAEPAVRASEVYDVRFVPLPVRTGCRPACETGQEMEIAHTGVDCDGVLSVMDAALFAEAVAGGIGPAKAFGFGLLSVASIK